MKTIPAQTVIDTVAQLCVAANRELPQDVVEALRRGMEREELPQARDILGQLVVNAELASRTGLPLCQDTGLGIFFVELGDDVRVEGMNLRQAINAGVAKGYTQGLLRKSSCEPFSRANTGDNTPAIIYFDLVPGDSLKITCMAKGFGAENMSRVILFAPAVGWKGLKEYVVRRVAESGSNPCPPVVVGLGIGGDMGLAATIAKKALLRPLDDVNPDPDLAAKEAELLEAINRLGVGPMGLGGRTTCLAVKIATTQCHIGSLALAVNIQCHSLRHKQAVL